VVWCLREPEDLPGEGDSHATFTSIDALCMHQSKQYIRERSKQVSIMGKIFQLANEVDKCAREARDNEIRQNHVCTSAFQD
jgi:hypothetical protein